MEVQGAGGRARDADAIPGRAVHAVESLAGLRGNAQEPARGGAAAAPGPGLGAAVAPADRHARAVAAPATPGLALLAQRALAVERGRAFADVAEDAAVAQQQVRPAA